MRRRVWLCVLCASAVSCAAELPRISYSKSFPGSDPAYVAITVAKDGNAEYRESPEEEPLRFKLSEKETAGLVALAEKLGRFKRPLESNLKVAKTGIKTFTYENGGEKNEVKFNYSVDPDAQALWNYFERITESERNLIALERAAKFDKLGVNQALLALEVSRDRARLVAPEQFLPILDRIAKNETYMHMARARAAKLAEGIRASGAGQQ